MGVQGLEESISVGDGVPGLLNLLLSGQTGCMITNGLRGEDFLKYFKVTRDKFRIACQDLLSSEEESAQKAPSESHEPNKGVRVLPRELEEQMPYVLRLDESSADVRYLAVLESFADTLCELRTLLDVLRTKNKSQRWAETKKKGWTNMKPKVQRQKKRKTG